MFDDPLPSEGKCLFCNERFSRKEIGKHLGKHLAGMEKTDSVIETNVYYHIVVESVEMFLHLLVKEDVKLKRIDKFLRDIWLECCGHLSEFGVNKSKIPMNQYVGNVFEPKIKIYHNYDFGSTTRVYLKCIKVFSLNLKDKLILLSRNEPLKFMCAVCKIKPAVNMCTYCNMDKYSFFCQDCSEKHSENCQKYDYGYSPVVNSPRMGECGYMGGSIDLERDGYYKEN